MSVHIIIDGYNFIRQSAALAQLDQTDLQLGRDALIDQLAAYKRIKRHQITVVFDGSGEFGDKGQEKGIKIKFSRQGETADSVIKRMAAREKTKALVVSSDREVADYSASKGAAVIGSGEFEEKMEMAAFMDMKGVSETSGSDEGWVPTTKKKGPSKRLPKKKRMNRKRLKKL
ncbi:MAG: NYN domain-containing protein [Dissulfuribacterales bacterium]